MTGDSRIVEILRGFEAGRRALEGSLECRAVQGGAVNSITRVTGEGIDWAVRMAAGSDIRLQVDRAGEFRAHEAAAEWQLAPAVVHSDVRAGVLISQWIDAALDGTDLFATATGLARVGETLRRLHDVPVPPGLRVVNARAVAEAYLSDPRAGTGKVTRAEYAVLLGGCLAQSAEGLVRFCHNDLHSGNVLDSGRLWLLDWEYAGAGDPRFDLAGIIAYHDLPPSLAQPLLQGYGQYSAIEMAPWVRLFDIVRCLWMDVADAWGTLPEPALSALLNRLRP